MNKSMYLHIMLLVAVLFTGLISEPLPVQANPNVVDWLNNEEPVEETPAETTETAPIEEKSLAGILVQLALYTLLIVVMIYGLIKFLAARQKNLQPNHGIRLMGGTPLGNNKSLQVVKVGGQIYLIGVGDEVTLIKEFSDEAEINSIEEDFEQQPALSKSLRAFSKKKEKATQASKATSFDELFNQSIDKQKNKQHQLENEFGSKSHNKEGRPL
ncbi:flagellar biosynthetic protein FliO [Planococcus sp. PAMC 21323]|uniref:flagellar biosynthetic protein FliO n=1 Tax=Planococcus sp. PAMC 21323 TaxID=1526927 RepID=UPI00056E7B80|nr:flagellar biosynthetic protein FliO [Planococcus sp. PAMC 21323]